VAATEFTPKQNESGAVTAHVIWMTTGLGCDGDSVGMTSATNPSLEDIITGAIPGMPRVVVHNPVLAFELRASGASATSARTWSALRCRRSRSPTSTCW
jgi:Ni,Fe-hydrogenase I small subunit